MTKLRHAGAAAAAATAAMLFACTATRAAGAQPTEKPRMTWGDCDPALVGGAYPALGARLHCAVMRAPLDHLAPDGRYIDVGVVRIAAGDPERREGAIFFNLGGPGGNPAEAVVGLAQTWLDSPADHAVHGSKRELGARYDLIAVIPRGLQGGWKLTCLTGLRPSYVSLAVDLSEKNWQRAVAEAKAVVNACTAAPEARYVNTEQHVRDMDAVRASLGDEKLSFLGMSYGGKVGAWYAAMFPERIHRMVLDSSIYFPGNYDQATTLSLEADQRDFHSHTIMPITAAPASYGLGTVAYDVETRILQLPDAARAAWAPLLGSPPSLLAALTLGDMIKMYGPANRAEFDARIAAHTFSPHATVDAFARHAAGLLLDAYYPGPAKPTFQLSPDGDSVRVATACNDDLWYRAEPLIRAHAVNRRLTMFTSTGEDVFEELVCHFWGRQTAREPDLDALKKAPPFLLVQSEFDIPTPLRGAEDIVRRFPNAHLIVARGSSQHGLFTLSHTPCVETGATDYLLDGRLPVADTRISGCFFQPAQHPAR